MNDIPQSFATEYCFALRGETIFITRYTNHGKLIPEDNWAACWYRGLSNPWYLNGTGEWKYKHGCTFNSAKEAYEYCLQYPPDPFAAES